MSKPLKRIAITGAAGQIAYSLLFRIAAGELFGKEQPIALHLLEIPEALPALEGIAMELEDCAFPCLQEVRCGDHPEKVFEGVEYALLVGAKPRGPGMERKDLLLENSKIFIAQGKALDAAADLNALVLVVGNPCNTNCLITLRQWKRLSPKRCFAMMRLDEHRASALLAKKAKVPVSAVRRVAIWGNHSSTQVPDFLHAEIGGKSALEVIGDRRWCEEEFIPAVQKRGAAVIAARGKSSAASAAHAAIEAFRSLITPTAAGNWFSCALLSDGNPYGIAEGLVFSFPCISLGGGVVKIAPGLTWDSFLREKIALTEKELLEEREMAHV